MPLKFHSGSGKLILSGSGKLTCACCETGCCMYPVQGLVDGDFTDSDLPSTLEYVGPGGPITLSKVASSISGLNTRYEGGSDPSEMYLDVNPDYPVGPLWNAGPGLAGGSSGCLVNSDGGFFIEDTFPGTLYATYDVYQNGALYESVTAELYRASLCRYSWNTVSYGFVDLQYNPSTYKWKYVVTAFGLVEVTLTGDRTPNQDTPVGSYDDSAVVSDGAFPWQVKNFVITE